MERGGEWGESELGAKFLVANGARFWWRMGTILCKILVALAWSQGE